MHTFYRSGAAGHRVRQWIQMSIASNVVDYGMIKTNSAHREIVKQPSPFVSTVVCFSWRTKIRQAIQWL